MEKDVKHQPNDFTHYLWLQTLYASNRLFQSLYFMGIYGDGWKNLNIRAWKTWPWFSSRLENLKRVVKPCKWHFLGDFTPFFVFLWPTKGVGFRQPKVFLFHLFKYTLYICSFCKKVVQRHMSRSFSTIRLFRRSLSCNFPFQQSGIGKNVNVSNMPPKAQLVLLSVYPTYPFTFYVNRTKRHVTWSICPHILLFNTISVLKLPLLYIYNLLLKINFLGALLRFIVRHRNLMIFCILRYTIFSGFFQFLIPIIIITVIYLRILLFLKVNKHKVLKVYLYMEIACFLCFFCYFFFLQRNRVSQPSLLAKQRKTNAILFSISLIFFVTWLPFRWLLPLLCILSVSRDIPSG